MSEWISTELGTICDEYGGVIKTGPFGSQLHQHDYVAEGTPVIMPKDIKGGKIELAEIARIDDTNVKRLSKHKVQVGDIVIPRRGEISKCTLITEEQAGFICGTGCLKITPPKKVLVPTYFRYYLSRSDTIEWLINNAVGATMLNLSGGILKRLPVVVPPLKEQKVLAAILSSYDDLIENNLKRIKLLEEMAQITYEEWFIRMKFPDHETAIFDEETGLPEGWEIDKLGSLLAKVPKSRKLKADEYQNQGKYPVIDQSRSFIAGYTDDEETMLELESAIVFGDHTRIVKFINFKFARGADGTQILLSNDNRVPQHLLYQLVQAIDLSDYHYARHFKYLKDTDVVIPSDIVAQKYEIKAKCYFDQILLLRNQIDLLKEARDILLPRLMTGMIDIEKVELPDAMLKRLEEQEDKMATA